MFFKGFVPTKNKQCLMQFKDKSSKDLLGFNEAQKLDEYAGILDKDSVLIDVDDMIQSEILLNIIEHKDVRCRVYKSTRGMHFLFKQNTKNPLIKKCATGTKVACGLTCDIKVGLKNSYEVLKFKGKEREIIYDIYEDEEYDLIPYWFTPIKDKSDFIGMGEGDGRNQSLFNYILKLQNAGLKKEEIKYTLNIINDFVLAKSVSEEELNVIMRDDAFKQDKKESFFTNEGKTFLFNKFSEYLIDKAHIKLINGSMHIYRKGVYVEGNTYIEKEMIKHIPLLNNARRSEVLKYLNLIVPVVNNSSAFNIAFLNGIYNLSENDLHDFDNEIVITNQIPHNYNENAYSEIADNVLNKIACNDKSIRMLLEEVIGYCFFRRNELRKAFILLGDKSNGKSTFLDMLKNVIGEENCSALDLKDIGDRFRTSEITGKLANIGDDIDDEFITNTAVFKKAVSGEQITMERKGQDAYKTNVYCKFIFSANNMPRIKDKTGAVIDRLVPVPFNATFSKDDADFDPYIKYKLQNEEVMEYLIKIGMEGLKRVLENKAFTTNEEIEREREEINERNNPILLFLKEITNDDIENKVAKDVYTRYSVWCLENGFQAMSYNEFTKYIKSNFDVDIQPRKIDGKAVRVYIKN